VYATFEYCTYSTFDCISIYIRKTSRCLSGHKIVTPTAGIVTPTDALYFGHEIIMLSYCNVDMLFRRGYAAWTESSKYVGIVLLIVQPIEKTMLKINNNKK
jgi:hypothetical protein